MMLTILLSVIQAAAPAAPAAPAELVVPRPALNTVKCPSTMHWAGGKRAAAVRRLDQLPPGRLELTVLRSIGHCLEPVVIREGIGGNPNAPEARETYGR